MKTSINYKTGIKYENFN